MAIVYGVRIFSVPDSLSVILSLSDLMIIEGSLSTNVTYGDNVTLRCFAVSGSPPINISWNTTTGNTLPEPITVRESDRYTYNSSLTLTNVDLTYTGLYSCVAIDNQSDKDVFPISLTVQGIHIQTHTCTINDNKCTHIHV